MNKLFIGLLFSISTIILSAQTTVIKNANTSLSVLRPKLVVGIVVDQMRWDYLYRYYPVFREDGGFKKLLNNGFSYENTMIPYTPTVTAAGHTCIYTGSVPAINGITGNNWFDNLTQQEVYCSEDNKEQTVGSTTAAVGRMSPRNMFTTTIGDELKLATNFKSKVIGIAIKDRGAILPAGHAANAAYWYDNKTGNFVSSTYYMKQLPTWVQNFNNRKIVDSLYRLNWNTLLAENVYNNYCTNDIMPFERKPLGINQASFPYNLSNFAGKDYGIIATTPYGNNLTLEMSKAAVVEENLGKNRVTDFLCVSLSSTDYIGHSFGPNSWEQLDDFARLDIELGKFLSFLDATVGNGEYTVFLTADHGVAHIPAFDSVFNLPGGAFDDSNLETDLNSGLKEEFGKDSIVSGIYNYQVVLNEPLIKKNSLSADNIINWIIKYLKKNEAVVNAFEIEKLSVTTLNGKQKEMIANGYYPSRCGQIQFILKPGYVEGKGIGTSHGLWNPYDAHIPLLWYGWGIPKGASNTEVYMTDIAPTLAALLHIQMPSGSVGKVLPFVSKGN